MDKSVDNVQQALARYAERLTYDALPREVVHAIKLRVIDTFGALMSGFSGEPCKLARSLSAKMLVPGASTIIGTHMKTTPDVAAFVNATTARYAEMNDTYHKPGVLAGHPSDALMPILGVAEQYRSSGRDFIASAVLAYEVHLRIADIVGIAPGFDYTNYVCLSTAIAAAKLMALTSEQLSNCISMAIISNNALLQARTGHLTMFKAIASGQAARAGIFAAFMAQEKMEGPNLPFEGTAGWCNVVARKGFELGPMGGDGVPFKVHDTIIKPRPSCGTTQSSILAAEKIRLAGYISDVSRIVVEVYKDAKDICGTGEHQWAPDSRETADHSIPYVVAATLLNGSITPAQFDDEYIRNPQLRALMQKIEVVENEEFTRLYQRQPMEHRTRITVLTGSAERFIGESDEQDLAKQGRDEAVSDKFRKLTQQSLGPTRTTYVLDQLWHLEDIQDLSSIPPAFAIS